MLCRAGSGGRVAGMAVAAVAAVALAGCVVVPIGLPSASDALEEVVVRSPEKRTKSKILLIDVSGVISTGEQGLLKPRKSVVEDLRDQLEKAAKDDRIEAVVLRINSPGGGVTASDLCHREVVRFKERVAKRRKEPIPVVAVLMDTAASGAYYVAMAADKIWAHPTTVTGSIGVVAILPELTGLAGKIGVDVRVFKSGDMKDAGSPWRSMTEPESKVFQDMVDSMYGRFVRVVSNGRDLPEAKVRELADGRIYTADQALKDCLVDEVGYLDDAMDAIVAERGIEAASVVAYRRGWDPKSNVYSRPNVPAPQAGPAQVNLLNIDLGQLARPSAPRFLYLWLP